MTLGERDREAGAVEEEEREGEGVEAADNVSRGVVELHEERVGKLVPVVFREVAGEDVGEGVGDPLPKRTGEGVGVSAKLAEKVTKLEGLPGSVLVGLGEAVGVCRAGVAVPWAGEEEAERDGGGDAMEVWDRLSSAVAVRRREGETLPEGTPVAVAVAEALVSAVNEGSRGDALGGREADASAGVAEPEAQAESGGLSVGVALRVAFVKRLCEAAGVKVSLELTVRA